MGKRIIISFALCLFVMTGCSAVFNKANVTPGQHAGVFEKTIKKTVRFNYQLYLPDGYSQKGGPWPLMIFLHGAGERGDDPELIKLHGLPKLAASGQSFPFIIASPQCPTEKWWPNLTDELNAFIDDIEAKYAVDPRRIYLTGLSMGGFGTWSLAISRPDRFAAIAPICGGSERYLAKNIKDIPVWVFHGAKDTVVPIERSEIMVRALEQLGADVRFTIYPDAGHDSWTETYEKKELYEWFLSHRKR